MTCLQNQLVNTPLLIRRGKTDERAPVGQVKIMHDMLKGHDKYLEFMLYDIGYF